MNADHINIKIPGYRIIRQIGEGGMSVVYLAFQESLKREVALKIMRPVVVDEGNVVKRFKQEAEIIAKLYHPNIVSIYDVGSLDDQILYYSMPYLQHGDLTGFAYHNDEELIRVLISLCQGFAYAHAQGVVHRDIKPENILFDQFGNVKIADFGIALSAGNRRFTKDQRIVGSIHYLSPEQARSKHVDARSDIYGLGAILYEVLTGSPVFDEGDDLAIMMAHVEKAVPRLPKKVSHWQPIIDKCLAKSPNQRFQSMQSLQDAIESLSPQVALGPIRRLQAWPYLLASGVFMLFVVGLVGWLNGSFISLNDPSSQHSTIPTAETIGTSDFVTTSSLNAEKGDDLVSLSDSNTMLELPEPQLSDSETEGLLVAAKSNIERKQLTTPASDNALDKLLTILKDQPNHLAAKTMLSEISDGYFELVYQSVLNHKISQAEGYAESVATVRHKVALVNEQLLKYLTDHSEMTVSLLLGTLAEQVRNAVANYNQNLGSRLIQLTDLLMPNHPIVAELYSELEQLPSGGQIKVDSMGIASVLVIPPVAADIKYGFYVTATEITYGQYQAFVKATNRSPEKCKSQLKTNLIFSQRTLENPGFAVSDEMPVICVSWQDAQDYSKWLNGQTGLDYRLLSADHWRIIATPGKALTCGRQNLAGLEFGAQETDKSLYPCDDGFPRLAPVKAFSASGNKLYGVQGNVKEWLSGCEDLGKIKGFFKPAQKCGSNPAAGLSWLSTLDDKSEIEQINNGEAWTHIGFRLMYR